MTGKKDVFIYDTTLRDGAQGEGVSFSLQDKLMIAAELDKFGVDYIEGGWPGSNPKDMEFFTSVHTLKLKNARVAAFGSTRHAKNTAAQDPNIKCLVAAKTPVIAVVGKSWDFHVTEALRVTLEQNLDMIESSIKYLSKKTDEVLYDAEHFFDGYKANPEYTLRTLEAALNGGAKALVLCDTNGGSLPDRIYDTIKTVLARFPGAQIGIHCHNDSGLAVANSISAVQAGAVQVQGTINGLGERTGNADLTQIIPITELKLGKRCLGKDSLKHLTETSRFIYEMANLQPRNSQPFVGRSAFAHKGGIHVSAIARNSSTYEHITPESVGNERRVLVSELSGRSNLKAQSIKELDNDPELMQEVLKRLMELENDGYAFEAAGASFNLLISRMAGIYTPDFALKSYRVTSEVDAGGAGVSEATVKVMIGDNMHHTVAEGEHGPVDALYNAMRKALAADFPVIEKLRLNDYKVHIINTRAATEAKVRVVIQSTDHEKVWGTVGVSANIIEASCHALVDSINYLLLQQKKKAAGTGSAKKCSR